jgi:hypothetical protein
MGIAVTILPCVSAWRFNRTAVAVFYVLYRLPGQGGTFTSSKAHTALAFIATSLVLIRSENSVNKNLKHIVIQ